MSIGILWAASHFSKRSTMRNISSVLSHNRLNSWSHNLMICISAVTSQISASNILHAAIFFFRTKKCRPVKDNETLREFAPQVELHCWARHNSFWLLPWFSHPSIPWAMFASLHFPLSLVGHISREIVRNWEIQNFPSIHALSPAPFLAVFSLLSPFQPTDLFRCSVFVWQFQPIFFHLFHFIAENWRSYLINQMSLS